MNDAHTRDDTDKNGPKQPLSVAELARIILSGHLGVRKRVHRVSDFDRANGLHVFLAAALYFAVIVTGLIALVSYIAA